MSPAKANVRTWDLVLECFIQPYPLNASVLVPLIILLLLVPCYIFIGDLMMPGRALHIPELPLDRLVPLKPVWTPIYASLYIFAILPLLIVRQQEQIRRTILAYLMVWVIAYISFLIYPTAAPPHAKLIGASFLAWSLRAIYAADVPYNCFPSLHVAHSFVSALTCYRVNRGVGIAACIWASFIGISTLYTKQHYFIDVIAGVFLAYLAYAVFLRSYPRDAIPETERRVAPFLSLGFIMVHALLIFCFWVVYRVRL